MWLACRCFKNFEYLWTCLADAQLPSFADSTTSDEFAKVCEVFQQNRQQVAFLDMLHVDLCKLIFSGNLTGR